MELKPGEKLGRYELLSPVGEGGMGEVWKAHDTQLGRDVALKVSKSEFTARFDREARAIAAFNHPNICQIYDVGPDYLVMELIDGETLAARLKRGKPSIEQTIQYGAQIAGALSAAHAKGVVHRDLKPGNVMIAKTGVKVLDFGLSKSARDETLTVTNAVMGTPAYMAPEQREGRESDARTDIYALGLMLSEMAGVTRTQPGARTQLDSLPGKLAHVIERCLAHDPDDRWQSARDVKSELEWATHTDVELAGPSPSAGWRRALPWVLFVATALAFAAFAWLRGPDARNAVETEPARFEIPLPELTQFTASFALSPDGRKLAFAASGSDGTPRIWIRDLNSLEMHPLAGTESVGTLLIWSPDSRSLAFDSGGKLLRDDVSGGSPRTVCSLDRVVFSGSWNRDGVILFGGIGGPVMRVPADGGVPSPVTALDTAHGDVAHTNPVFLPDGRRFAYVRDTATNSAISVGSLNATPGEQESRRLIEGVTGPMYVPSPGSDPGQLMFVRGTALMAQKFDPRSLTLSGDPVRVMDAPVGPYFDSGLYSVAGNGTLAYRAPGNPRSQLTWLDEKGKSLAKVGPPGPYTTMALSPDGTRALVSRGEPSGNRSVWLIDTSRGTSTPLANDPSSDYSPRVAWSPDGRSMIFGPAHSGEMADLYEKPIDAAGDGTKLLHSGKWKDPLSWSRDGFLLFNVTGKGLELWALPLKGPGSTAVPLLQGGPNYLDAHFSPDGHWVAYESNESTRFEVYVKSFSAGHLGEGGRVSPDGGFSPRWSSDGKQLYYLGLDYRLMTMKLTLGTTVQAGAPTELFPAPHTFNWAPSPDGKRFLFLVPPQQQNTPLTVVLNWQAGLKK